MRPFALGLGVSVAFLLVILVAIRRRALRDQMAVLWLAVSVAMLAMGVALPFHLLDHIARAVGVRYGSDLLFGAAVVFLVLLVLQLSVAVARLHARTTRLAQELGILLMDDRPLRPSQAGPDNSPVA